MTGRFAPTPSGRMHIGNVYAMLGAWLSARSRGDRMLMRIEDVDKPRVVAGADQLMMDDLHWLGLDWMANRCSNPSALNDTNTLSNACARKVCCTPCFCSRADIRAASAPNEGDGFMVYPGTCRRLLHDHPDEVRARLVRGDQHSIRIAMPESAAGEKQRTVPDDSAALSGAVPPEQQGDAGIVDGVACFNDRVYSPQHYDLAREVGDSVIRRADGLFGYQLVVVVDDLDMGVDDIVRGRDLLRSTALQMWIRQCLLAGGFEPECGNTEKPLAEHPEYAHLPLIDNAAGRRLAKRERSLDMGALRARNVTPEQIIGYCAWLLRLQPTPIPCKPADLLADFSWEPLRANHLDRALKPDDPTTPQWLAEALG